MAIKNKDFYNTIKIIDLDEKWVVGWCKAGDINDKAKLRKV